MKRIFTVLLFFALGTTCFTPLHSFAQSKYPLRKAKVGSKVTIEYAVVVEDAMVESSKQNGPLTFTIGKGEVVAGLEEAVTGMRIGEIKSFAVPPEKGYGQATEPVVELPLSSLPPDIVPEKRMILFLDDESGKKRFVTIVEVKEKSVVVDLNHPLAGKELLFEVEVLDIE